MFGLATFSNVDQRKDMVLSGGRKESTVQALIMGRSETGPMCQ